MTQIVLPRLRLSSVEEFQPRVALSRPRPECCGWFCRSTNLPMRFAAVPGSIPGEMFTHRAGRQPDGPALKHAARKGSPFVLLANSA
jgi:hypothetical protein